MQKWLESAKESLPLSKKQKSPREKYIKNTKSKNINLKSMIKKQREKREVVLESKKDQAKRDFLLNLNVRVEVEYETKKAVKRKYIQNYPVQNIVKKGEYKEEIKKKMVDDLTMKLRSYGSGFASVDILSVEESEHDIIDGGENKNIKMKEARALPIDGHETQAWDTKTGKCV